MQAPTVGAHRRRPPQTHAIGGHHVLADTGSPGKGGTPAEPGGAETVAGRAAGAATAQVSTAEMLRLELAEEQQAIKDYAAEIAEIMDDEETLDMLQEHLDDEIEHSRWMKAQLAALEG